MAVMRILQVVGWMNIGGIETWLMHILRNIDKNRFKIDFLAHSLEKCDYDEEILSYGSRIILYVNYRRPLKYAKNFK